jgi:LPS export ABC transporter protein LptC
MVTSGRIRWLLAAAIILASIYLSVHIFLRVRQSEPAGQPEVPSRSGADLSLEQFRFSEVKGGVTRWELVAARADHDRGKGITLLERPVMTVPATKGHGSIRLTSDRAEYDDRTRDVRLRGNVVATGDRGGVFRTGHADFQAASSRISTTDRVSFQQPGLAVTGIGMELSTESRNVRVLSAVEATVTPLSKKKAP